MTVEIARRTFEAKQHPKGSPERARLNLDARTSEYMTSYRYCAVEADGRSTRTFRTRAEAAAVVSPASL
jgi:hypothetical protein